MKKMICLSIISLFIFILCLSLKEYNNNEVLKDSNSLKNYNINTITMMYETEANSGIYEANKNTLWPSDGYIFNATLSKCENGSELSWDESAKKVIMSGSVSDKCYVYFDVIPTKKLTDFIKKLYKNQGTNNLYYHDSSLSNGANDNSYRYAGKYESVNNYVCFGYDDPNKTYVSSWCPASNLYRIIGVFNEKVINSDGTDTGKKEERVKLILNNYAGESILGKVQDGTTAQYTLFTGVSKPSGDQPAYYWSGSRDNISSSWKRSTFNTETLNGTYLTKMGSDWANKIATSEWKIGGNTYENIITVIPATAYQNEIINCTADWSGNKTSNAKTGLIYVSDYAFAASTVNWTTNISNYDNDTNRNNNWLFRGISECAIPSYKTVNNYSLTLNSAGNVGMSSVYSDLKAARPVFYLNNSVIYNGGTGTQTDPFRIS